MAQTLPKDVLNLLMFEGNRWSNQREISRISVDEVYILIVNGVVKKNLNAW